MLLAANKDASAYERPLRNQSVLGTACAQGGSDQLHTVDRQACRFDRGVPEDVRYVECLLCGVDPPPDRYMRPVYTLLKVVAEAGGGCVDRAYQRLHRGNLAHGSKPHDMRSARMRKRAKMIGRQFGCVVPADCFGKLPG